MSVPADHCGRLEDGHLPFWGGGSCPVQYFVDYEGAEYYVRYRSGCLSVSIGYEHPDVFWQQIGGRYDGVWTDNETTAYLFEISTAIRRDSLRNLVLPSLFEVRRHPMYRVAGLPLHPVGMVCGLRESPDAPPKGNMNRHERKRRRRAGFHDHGIACIHHVRACDVEEWVEAHPVEHHAYREYCSGWAQYQRLQETRVDDDNVRHWPDPEQG